MAKPLILTMGDPTGIGPEIIVKTAASEAFATIDRPVVVAGDLEFLLEAARICQLSAREVSSFSSRLGLRQLEINGQALLLAPLSSLPRTSFGSGQPNSACCRAMAEYIRWACDACLAGDAAGMVTAPINKQALQAAGEPFPGHTELLASRCGVERVVMMLAGQKLRVCLVTTHCPLREVSGRLSVDTILTTLHITAKALKQFFGLNNPRMAVLALNPHAGEGGLFGWEESELIQPAIEQALSEGLSVSGPHSADSLFWFAVRGDYDAVICMYHDQGLIPLKLLHFEEGVNVTLGLPIIRTSVDHGTAYDLAGTGQAKPNSLIAALKTATEMANNRARVLI